MNVWTSTRARATSGSVLRDLLDAPSLRRSKGIDDETMYRSILHDALPTIGTTRLTSGRDDLRLALDAIDVLAPSDPRTLELLTAALHRVRQRVERGINPNLDDIRLAEGFASRFQPGSPAEDSVVRRIRSALTANAARLDGSVTDGLDGWVDLAEVGGAIQAGDLLTRMRSMGERAARAGAAHTIDW